MGTIRANGDCIWQGTREASRDSLLISYPMAPTNAP